MAKGYEEIDRLCREITTNAKQDIFSPVYLLMGDEPYYPDMVCNALIENALSEDERDFNQTIFYGSEAEPDTVITAARRYPMMSKRQLVVLKEAQLMRNLDQLSVYCEKPLESTVLVILLHRASADKRKSLYKSVSKIGKIVDSESLKDYELSKWITNYYRENNLEISPEAVALFAESVGTDLSKIAVETEKMLKNLPEGVKTISVENVEKNVGISRQYSIFELTKELSYKKTTHALKIAAHIGTSPKFAMPMAVSALFSHFNRILKYSALLYETGGHPTSEQKAKTLQINPYFYKEYDAAVSNYPLKKCMSIVSLLCDYDYKGKGGDTGEADSGDLLLELVAGILNA